MHNLRKNFDTVLPIIQELLQNDVDKAGNVPKPGPKPKFSDVEVITLSLVSDSLLIDSEHYLFKKLHREYRSDFPNLIERSVYNKRRRLLAPLMNKVRSALVDKLVIYEDTFVLDSLSAARQACLSRYVSLLVLNGLRSAKNMNAHLQPLVIVLLRSKPIMVINFMVFVPWKG